MTDWFLGRCAGQGANQIISVSVNILQLADPHPDGRAVAGVRTQLVAGSGTVPGWERASSMSLESLTFHFQL